MIPRNATELVVLVENRLGWLPEVTPQRPLWKVRAIEAGKLKKKIATNSTLYTFENLALTVEYLFRRRQEVRSPMALFYYVQKALDAGPGEKELSDLGQDIQAAINAESGRQDDESRQWVSRLTRAHGPARADVLREWQEAGRDR